MSLHILVTGGAGYIIIDPALKLSELGVAAELARQTMEQAPLLQNKGRLNSSHTCLPYIGVLKHQLGARTLSGFCSIMCRVFAATLRVWKIYPWVLSIHCASASSADWPARGTTCS
jgi:hypothetical protein